MARRSPYLIIAAYGASAIQGGTLWGRKQGAILLGHPSIWCGCCLAMEVMACDVSTRFHPKGLFLDETWLYSLECAQFRIIVSKTQCGEGWLFSTPLNYVVIQHWWYLLKISDLLVTKDIIMSLFNLKLFLNDFKRKLLFMFLVCSFLSYHNLRNDKLRMHPSFGGSLGWFHIVNIAH